MKKLLNIFVAVALAIVAMVAVSACSEEDESENKCYFTLGIDNLSISGPSSEQEVISSYMAEVEKAYFEVLGMSSSDNTLIVDGDFKTVSAEMVKKFNSAALPTPIETSCQYSFDMILYGNQMSQAQTLKVVASKTFTNK